MAVLKRILVSNYRNIAFQELDFCPKINCISGGNGEGKTNLLDAIWYLSMTKSAFAPSDKFNFRHGCNSFSISGEYLVDGKSTRIGISVEDGSEKKIKRDDKVYRKASDHIGLLPVVMVSPADTSLVSESGDERRKFVNAVLSQMDRKYLSDLQQYNRVLAQRNSLLKSGAADESLLDTLDERLEALGAPVYEKRKEFADRLSPLVGKYYREISGGEENVSIEYRSDLAKGPLAEMLKAGRERDRILKFTFCGVQRDDFLFGLDGYPIRKCGSQGQQKSFLVALKFAQYELMAGYGSPILLLDDLFDKLDMNRVENLLRTVSGNGFGQIFLSDSNKHRLSTIMEKLGTERSYCEAKGGVFTRIDE